MNIEDYMGGLAPTPALSDESLKDLMILRARTFKGFMDREVDKGIAFIPIDLRTPKGQDVARLMFWRIIEEYAESINAESIEHRLEELIDAFNYTAGTFIFTQGMKGISVEDFQFKYQKENPTYDRMGRIALKLANVTEVFRNRAWMENAQSSYFDGLEIYRETLVETMRACCRCFSSWDEFWRYFMAKDAVLQFRLRSNY